MSQLPPKTWDYIDPIRSTVLAAIEDITPRYLSYVFTNALEVAEGAPLFARIKQLAAKRNAVFLPVFLSCDLEVQAQRITSEQRKQRLKMSDAGQLKDYLRDHEIYVPNDPDTLFLSTTELSIEQSAEKIIAAANALKTT